MTEPTRARTRLDKAFQQQNWSMVRHRAAILLRETPDDADLHFMAGMADLETGASSAAAEALGRAASLDPARADYLAQHARALARMRRLRDACAVADRAMALDPQDAPVAEQLGQVYLQALALERAGEAFRLATILRPGHAPYRFLLGYVLAALGDARGAERQLEHCIDLDPRQWAAHLSLSRLKPQTDESHHRERLREQLAMHANDRGAQIFLNMALAKESEDLGDYPGAFAYYGRGKAAARATRPPSADRDRRMFDAIIDAFPEPLPDPDGDGDPDAPIFIFGMPRTGTTLLNRILSNHPEVAAAGELQAFVTVLQKASGSPIALLSQPDIAAHVKDIDWARLGADYLEDARPAGTDAPRFTDDMPHHFLYAGFIARALPRARMLCLRRHPLDTCLGNFRHLFNLESGFYDYSLDLLDIGRYYLQFDRLMAHWERVLPGRIHEVSYASLVRDPEPVVRELLSTCGLSWDPACLDTESNTAPVNTPSAWQVRSPIYASAVGRWKRYEDQVRPLRELLEGAGIDCGDD